MDKLEKYIRDNREDFDNKQPPARIWEQLDKALPEQKHKRIQLWRGFRVAASVLILLAVGALLGSYLTSRNFEAENLASKLPNDFSELEQYYQQEVSARMNQLVTLKVDEDQVRLDLEQLDIAMEELKSDILSAPKGSEEQIIDAIILNYKTKIDILETIMEHINSDSTHIQNDKKDESISL